jgi:hypothetical protein
MLSQHRPEGVLPPSVMPPQRLADEIVLALEMIVEGSLGDADLLQNGV